MLQTSETGFIRGIVRFCILSCLVGCISAFVNMDKGASDVDLDELVELTLTCFWQILCELNEPLALKGCLKDVDEKEILFGMNTLKPHLPEHIASQLNLKNALNDSFWVDVLHPEVCIIPKRERDEASYEINHKFHVHFTDLCFNPMYADRCAKLTTVSKTYNTMQGQKYESGECHLDEKD